MTHLVERAGVSEVIKRVKALLGEIDVDACVLGNLQPCDAKTYYNKEEGLALPWRGRVFVRPPIDDIWRWTETMIEERACGNLSEAVLLAPAQTCTAWFQRLARSTHFCFLSAELGFGVPHALFYLGPKTPDQFLRVFEALGYCYHSAYFDASPD